MFKYSKKSEKILDTVNEYLVKAAKLTISRSKIDMSIAEWAGLRTANYQKELYDKGWSKADGTNIKSNHQLTDDHGKSRALDLCAYYRGNQNWNKERLVYIAVLMLEAFEELKRYGKIPKDQYIHWGGYWSSKDDGMGWDLPHFELRTTKQKPSV
jgi:hypothetical protein